VPAYPGYPGTKAVKRMCMYVILINNYNSSQLQHGNANSETALAIITGAVGVCITVSDKTSVE